MQKDICGFQLIELLVVLAIISILIAFSLPLYSQYLIQEKRLEAVETLSKLAVAMEQYHVQNDTYKHAKLSSLHFPEFIAKKNYKLLILSATDHDYVLAAKPQGKQIEKDKVCDTLILNSNGKKGISGTGSVEECW